MFTQTQSDLFIGIWAIFTLQSGNAYCILPEPSGARLAHWKGMRYKYLYLRPLFPASLQNFTKSTVPQGITRHHANAYADTHAHTEITRGKMETTSYSLLLPRAHVSRRELLTYARLEVGGHCHQYSSCREKHASWSDTVLRDFEEDFSIWQMGHNFLTHFKHTHRIHTHLFIIVVALINLF